MVADGPDTADGLVAPTVVHALVAARGPAAALVAADMPWAAAAT
jgi:hypothetical protein